MTNSCTPSKGELLRKLGDSFRRRPLEVHGPAPQRNDRGGREHVAVLGGEDRLCGGREHLRVSLENRTFPPGTIGREGILGRGNSRCKGREVGSSQGHLGKVGGSREGLRWAPSQIPIRSCLPCFPPPPAVLRPITLWQPYLKHLKTLKQVPSRSRVGPGGSGATASGPNLVTL